MYAANLMKVKFRFSGPSLQLTFNRFPTLRYQKEEESDSYIVEGGPFDKKGNRMWLLS